MVPVVRWAAGFLQRTVRGRMARRRATGVQLVSRCGACGESLPYSGKVAAPLCDRCLSVPDVEEARAGFEAQRVYQTPHIDLRKIRMKLEARGLHPVAVEAMVDSCAALNRRKLRLINGGAS